MSSSSVTQVSSYKEVFNILNDLSKISVGDKLVFDTKSNKIFVEKGNSVTRTCSNVFNSYCKPYIPFTTYYLRDIKCLSGRIEIIRTFANSKICLSDEEHENLSLSALQASEGLNNLFHTYCPSEKCKQPANVAKEVDKSKQPANVTKEVDKSKQPKIIESSLSPLEKGELILKARQDLMELIDISSNVSTLFNRGRQKIGANQISYFGYTVQFLKDWTIGWMKTKEKIN